MADPVATLLRRSLRHLEVEVPDGYRRLAGVLGPLVVQVSADGSSPFSLRADRCRLTVQDGVSASAGAWVGTTRAAIIQVLDAEVSLAEAVESGLIEVRGPLDDVLRLHDTLIAYAHAAVRAPSVPALVSALRGGMSGGTG